MTDPFRAERPPYLADTVAHHYPEDSNATTVFVLGLLSVVLLPLLGPFAWALGTAELRGIDAGRRSPKDRQLAKAGQILGIISSVLLIVLLVLLVVVLAAAFVFTVRG